MAHQTASAAAFKSKMASRMTARTLVRTALQRAGKPLTLHQLYECVSSNSDIIPSKTFFRNDVLSPLKANAQVRSVTPSATGENEYRFRLANTPQVADILAIDQQRWETVGESYTLSFEHLSGEPAKTTNSHTDGEARDASNLQLRRVQATKRLSALSPLLERQSKARPNSRSDDWSVLSIVLVNALDFLQAFKADAVSSVLGVILRF